LGDIRALQGGLFPRPPAGARKAWRALRGDQERHRFAGGVIGNGNRSLNGRLRAAFHFYLRPIARFVAQIGVESRAAVGGDPQAPAARI